MPQFFERVSLKPGENVAAILNRYDVEASRWPEIRNLKQNTHLPTAAGLLAGPPQVPSVCVPIDNFTIIVNYRIAKDTVNGLRPTNTAFTPAERAAFVKQCAHGVDISIERSGNPCVGFRWVQTVKKRNATTFMGLVSPPEFVDTGATGYPFYNGWNGPNTADDRDFTDVPCGPAPSKPGAGMDFHATVSLAVWTSPRLTIIQGYTYRFQILPAGAVWLTKPTDATDADYTEQVRILKAGLGALRQDSGKGLEYRKPPTFGTTNQ